jgi:hypothetical protein
MCATQQTSKFAEYITPTNPVKSSMTHTESKALREKTSEPDDETCIPCLTRIQTNKSFVQDPENIAKYVLAMRAAIQKQGERLRAEAAERESINEAKDADDFHIKVVKYRPAPLILDAQVLGRDFVGRLKAKARQVTFAFPSRKYEGSSKLASIDQPKPVTRSGPKTFVKAPTAKQSYTKVRSLIAALAVPSQKVTSPKPAHNPFADSASSLDDELEETALLSNLRPIQWRDLTAPNSCISSLSYRARASSASCVDGVEVRKSLDISMRAVKSGLGKVQLHLSRALGTQKRGRGWQRLE